MHYDVELIVEADRFLAEARELIERRALADGNIETVVENATV